jgi:hypothetical protein
VLSGSGAGELGNSGAEKSLQPIMSRVTRSVYKKTVRGMFISFWYSIARNRRTCNRFVPSNS